MTAMNENIELMMPIKRSYDHQKKAFAFACDKFGVFDERLKSRSTALLMEMGTGKTIVSIAIAGVCTNNGKSTVCWGSRRFPSSVYGRREFEKFADSVFHDHPQGTRGEDEGAAHKVAGRGLAGRGRKLRIAWRLEKELLAITPTW